MTNEAKLIKYFGSNDANLADLPKKISGIQISRVLIGEEMGCSFCFSHGLETSNNKYKKLQRSWKEHRKTQWKVVK